MKFCILCEKFEERLGSSESNFITNKSSWIKVCKKGALNPEPHTSNSKSNLLPLELKLSTNWWMCFFCCRWQFGGTTDALKGKRCLWAWLKLCWTIWTCRTLWLAGTSCSGPRHWLVVPRRLAYHGAAPSLV